MCNPPLGSKQCQNEKVFFICVLCPAQCFRLDVKIINTVFSEADTSYIVLRIAGLLHLLTMRKKNRMKKRRRKRRKMRTNEKERKISRGD